MTPIHDRMPVILPDTIWDPWLDPEVTDAGVIKDLLASAAIPALVEHAVSTLVNRVANDVPELISPLESGAV